MPPPWWRLGWSRRFWVLLLVTSVTSGLVAIAVKKLLRAVQHAGWSYSSGQFADAVGKAAPDRRVVLMLVAGLLAGVGWWLLHRVAGTRGGELNDAVWAGHGDVSLAPTVVTATLSTTIIAMGASLGREAPPKEAAAAIASWLGRGRLSRQERALLVACAAGAAWAGVYNIPLAGGVFAAEVLAGSLMLPIALPAVMSAVIATGVSWIVLPVHSYYQALPSYRVSLPLLIWSALVGPLVGVAAAGFVRLLHTANVHRVGGRWLLVGPLAGFAVVAALAIPYPQLLGNGKDIGEQLFLGGMSLPLIAALLVLKPLVTVVCWGSGASGGMFTPTTSYGALLGALLGHLWSLAWPGAPVGAYALIGASAMVSAAMAAPVAAVVLMVELTHHALSLMVPILLAVAGATLVVRALGVGSIYSVRLPVGKDAARWRASGWWARPAVDGAERAGLREGAAERVRRS